MSKGATVLMVLGVLAILAGLAFIALDLLGKGDTSGIDYKDVGIIVVGIVLAGIGAALSGRKPAAA